VRYKLGDRRLDGIEPYDWFLDYEDEDEDDKNEENEEEEDEDEDEG